MASTPESETLARLSYQVDRDDPGDISGYTVSAVDGELGKVDKRDMDAGAAHLLVSTGRWIFGKTVMLPADTVDRIDHEHETVHVRATRDQIRSAPPYDPDRRSGATGGDRLGPHRRGA